MIVANRFLAGTRAVISFFAGMSQLEFWRTTLLCTLSALVWNGVIIYLGMVLGNNWKLGEKILAQYGEVVSIILGALVLFFVVRWWIRRRRQKSEGSE